jgi:hypothetical protein
MRSGLFLLAAAMVLGCGGGVVSNAPADSGDDEPLDGQSGIPDGSLVDTTNSTDATNPTTDGSAVDSSNADSSTTQMGGGVVDAGYYQGDGSFFVEGGAYPDASGGSDASTSGDSGSIDASPGCAALAACCPSLSGSTQSLCETISGLGDATNCATELAQLEGAGECTGVSVLASQIQVQPNALVSDGNLLFWTTEGSPSLLAMPVTGGRITILLDSPISNPVGIVTGPFLAVDDVNVYVLMNNSLVRIPKDGSAATLVNELGGVLQAVTKLGGAAYWLEVIDPGETWPTLALKSAPLQGTSVSDVATFLIMDNSGDSLAVTSSTVFAGGAQGFYDFPFSAVPPNGTPNVTSVPAATPCGALTSDTNAIYCSCVNFQPTCSNLAIANDGTATTLGQGINSTPIVFDATSVYWADYTTVGTIMKTPKTGGTPTVLAHDTSPATIAVDANSVYWSDANGFIKSVAK